MEMNELEAHIEKDKRAKQAGIAIALCSLLLALLVVVTPYLTREESVAEVPTAPKPNLFADTVIAGKAGIVYDLSTNEVLFEKNADVQLPLASITKLLTLYAATDAIPLTATVPITESALAQEGDSGLSVSDAYSFYDLAKIAIVSSSNDAAAAIADEAAKRRALSSPRLLAAAAESIGLTETYAVNGTGLDENELVSGGYGSARDVALLAGALVKKAPDIARASTNGTVVIRTPGGSVREFKNTNAGVAHVPGILLSKTGFTDLAGGNLVIVFDAAIGHPVAIVVLGSTEENRFTDVERLRKVTLAHLAQ